MSLRGRRRFIFQCLPSRSPRELIAWSSEAKAPQGPAAGEEQLQREADIYRGRATLAEEKCTALLLQQAKT